MSGAIERTSPNSFGPIRERIDPEAPQNFPLQPFHRLGFRVVLVIVAEQVQQAVHDKVLNVMHGRNGALTRLAQNRLERQHQVAQIAAPRYRHRAAPGKETRARWWAHPCRDSSH